MSNDQRSGPRVLHYFDCRWFGKWGSIEARLSDLSASGCRIVNRLTSPSVGEVVEIEIIRTAAEPLALSGEVVNVDRGVGFGVRFVGLEDDACDHIEALVAEAQTSNRRVSGT